MPHPVLGGAILCFFVTTFSSGPPLAVFLSFLGCRQYPRVLRSFWDCRGYFSLSILYCKIFFVKSTRWSISVSVGNRIPHTFQGRT